MSNLAEWLTVFAYVGFALFIIWAIFKNRN